MTKKHLEIINKLELLGGDKYTFTAINSPYTQIIGSKVKLLCKKHHTEKTCDVQSFIKGQVQCSECLVEKQREGKKLDLIKKLEPLVTNNLNNKHPIKVLTQNQWVDYNQLAR